MNARADELPRSLREIDEAADRDLERMNNALGRHESINSTGDVSHSRENRSAPEPLRRPVPPPKPYPIAELGPILRPACEAIRRVVRAPDAICGGSLLAAAALAAQGLANVEIDGRVYPLTLWLLSIAESGERKTAVDAEATRAGREYEKDLARDYADAFRVYEAQGEEWNTRREKAKSEAKKGGGAGLAATLGEIGPAPEPPLRPVLLAADFTAEGLAKLLSAGRPSIGAFTDEAALVFGGHGMTREAVTRTAGTLSKLWDSGTLDRIRAAEGSMKLWGRRLSLHLMAQPVIAESALSNEILSGQGFLPRCLLAWPESTAGTREYQCESLRDDPAMIQFNARMADLLRRPMPMMEGQRNELNLPSLSLNPDAKAAWRVLYDAIEKAMGPAGRYATAKAWASKTPEQCLRIAGVLTIAENPNAVSIDLSAIERASELAIWHLDEAVRLAGTAELSVEVRDAEALLNWCHETGRTMLYSSDALRLGPSRIRERSRFMQGMAELERAGWADKFKDGATINGKHRRHAWKIAAKAEGC